MDRRSSMPGRSDRVGSGTASAGRGVLRQFRPGISDLWLTGASSNAGGSADRRASSAVLKDSNRLHRGSRPHGRPPLPGSTANHTSHLPLQPSSSEQKVTCPECLASFHNQSALQAHVVRRHEASSNADTLSCPHCSEIIKHRTNLYRHIRVKHDEKTNRFHCRKCSFSASTESDLNTHKEKHRSCPYCHVAMESGTGLSKHMQTCVLRRAV